MKSMKAIRQAHRISLFHSVLEHEELFLTLISTLDTLKPSHDIVTRGANNLNYLTCNTNTFLHSFLIRTARGTLHWQQHYSGLTKKVVKH